MDKITADQWFFFIILDANAEKRKTASNRHGKINTRTDFLSVIRFFSDLKPVHLYVHTMTNTKRYTKNGNQTKRSISDVTNQLSFLVL